MSYTVEVATRATLHQLIDALSESSLEYAEHNLLRLLAAEQDGFWEQLEKAPVDDEPLSPATIAKLDAAQRRLRDRRQALMTNIRKP